MPSSSVRAFTDPDDYAGSLQGTTAELTIIERGPFAAKLTRIKLHRQWMQRFSESLSRIGHYTNDAGRAVITFRTRPGPDLIAAGLDMGITNILFHSHAQEYFRRSAGPVDFASMSLPIEDLAAAGAAIAGRELTLPHDALSIVPSSMVKARLLDLHAAAGTLAEHAPAVVGNSEAALGLEQALIEATVDCLVHGDVNEDRAARRRHGLIMRRFRAALDEYPDQALFIPEICKAIGVSRRTLQVCCEEQLGTNPKRYLLLRRMSLARQALRGSAPRETTVTEIATRYGFWQFGRFAGEYRSLFGELPSATLARPVH
jgi:AraC-like DNA-binding protein